MTNNPHQHRQRRATAPTSTTTSRSRSTSLPASKGKRSTITTITTTTSKFRARQHGHGSGSGIFSTPNKKQRQSAWALASPRFSGTTKYHEAMMKGSQNDDNRRPMSPDGRRFNNYHNRKEMLQSPQSCQLLNRGRRKNTNMYGRHYSFDDCDNHYFDDERLGYRDVPTLEVRIPSYDMVMSRAHTLSGSNSNINSNSNSNSNSNGNSSSATDNHGNYTANTGSKTGTATNTATATLTATIATATNKDILRSKGENRGVRKDTSDKNESNITSPPKARRLDMTHHNHDQNDDEDRNDDNNDNYEYEYDNLIVPMSSSLTDSHDSDFAPLLTPSTKGDEAEENGNNHVVDDDDDEGISYSDYGNDTKNGQEEKYQHSYIHEREKQAMSRVHKQEKGETHEQILKGRRRKTNDEVLSSPHKNDNLDGGNENENKDNDKENEDDNQDHDHDLELATCLSCQKSQHKIELQQSDIIATVPQLLFSLKRLENTVEKLAVEVKKKDEIIEKLKKNNNSLNTDEGATNSMDDLQQVGDGQGNSNIDGEQTLVQKSLHLSKRQICYSCNLGLEPDCNNSVACTLEQKINSNNDEVRVLKEKHQNEILKLKEIHRREFLDLQDKTLKWIVSKSDSMQEQARSLAYMKEEMTVLRENYNELKSSAKNAFVEAQNAIAKNCKTLSLYVEEEIRESEQAASEIINDLRQDLQVAQDKIIVLQNRPSPYQHRDGSEKISVLQPLSISNIQSWEDFSAKFRDAIDGKMSVDESTETKLDSAGILKAETLFKELCFDPSIDTDSTMDVDDFQDSYEDEEAMVHQEQEQNFELIIQ